MFDFGTHTTRKNLYTNKVTYLVLVTIPELNRGDMLLPFSFLNFETKRTVFSTTFSSQRSFCHNIWKFKRDHYIAIPREGEGH